MTAVETKEQGGLKAFILAPEGLRAGSDFYVLPEWTEALVWGAGADPRAYAPVRPLITRDLGVRGLKAMAHLSDDDVARDEQGRPHGPGFRLPLRSFPLGSTVCAIGSTWIKAGGASGKVLERDALRDRVRVKQPSGEVRWMDGGLEATLGTVALHPAAGEILGKAGVNRRLGRRPHVRGVAMNPVDHPHGGGEGRTSGGRPSVTPWGKPTKGQPTRRKAWHPWVVTPRLRAWQKDA